MLVQAPMGSGKSYYIENKIPKTERYNFIDGDILLESLGIKNRNYFWYDKTKESERDLIIDAFDNALKDGKIILYSGNPSYIKTDVLVIPDYQIRRDRLRNRKDFKPSIKQIDREQMTYEGESLSVPIVFNSDIPDYRILYSIRDSILSL